MFGWCQRSLASAQLNGKIFLPRDFHVCISDGISGRNHTENEKTSSFVKLGSSILFVSVLPRNLE